MIKKLNAVLTWILTVSLIGHIIMTVSSLLGGSHNSAAGTVFSAVTVITVCLHAVISIGIMMFAADGTAAFRYAKINTMTVIQRVSAIAVTVLIHFHLGAFEFIHSSPLTGLTVPDAVRLVLTELLFFVSVLVHLGVSFSRSAVVFGGVSDKRKMRKIDTVIYSVCGIIFAVIMFALIRFTLIWIAIGG